jgi:hypothetical protein
MAARKDYQAKKAQAEQPEPIERVLTVKGEPIPPHLAHLIAYELTDQGIAAESAKRKAHGVATPGLSVAADDWDKRVKQFEDDAHTGSEPWEQPDPVQAAISRSADPKGKAFHLLSGATVEKEGMRGYQPERDRNGELIKVGNMVLASMDERRAAKREAYFRAQALEAEQGPAGSLQEMSRDGVIALSAKETVSGRTAYTGEDGPATIGHTREHVDAGAILTGG